VGLAKDAMAVGINCTKPELITKLLRSAKSGKPFIVYPNSGKLWDAKNKVWTGNAAAGFSSKLVNEWIEAGAQIIGGCCGIRAAQISEMSLSNELTFTLVLQLV
jgi:homocysteine S-methyltransferase